MRKKIKAVSLGNGPTVFSLGSGENFFLKIFGCLVSIFFLVKMPSAKRAIFYSKKLRKAAS